MTWLFLLLSNMQNGFIRTKVGVSLKKKFSLKKSEKNSKKKPLDFQVAIRDVRRCRFARRVQTGLQRCKICKVQSQSCASAPSQLFAAPREFRADPARLLANSFSCYCCSAKTLQFSEVAPKRGFFLFCYQNKGKTMQFWYRTFLKDSSQDAKLSISEEWIPIVLDCNFFLQSKAKTQFWR